jgi:RNA-dependent RNA polymerase
MTDGCGYVNGAALMRISRIRNLPHRPTAVQGRIAGAKGLWILHPSDRDPKEAPKIWIRKSQRKIDLGPFSNLSRSHRVFDLVAPSRTHTPDRLSMQCILCLSHNGVPDDVFVSFMRDGLQEEVQRLTDWTRPNAMVFLLHAINNAGNVSGVRMQRQALGAARALGLTGRNYGRKDDVAKDGEDSNPFDDSTSSGRSSYSGEPFSLHEVAFELVQAGFHPAESQHLYEKIRYILTHTIKDHIRQFHFPIPQSARAFIIPGTVSVHSIRSLSHWCLQIPVAYCKKAKYTSDPRNL